MLLLNKTLIRMSRGLWGWIGVIVGLKLIALVGTAQFAQIISGFLGNISSPSLTVQQAGGAVLSALVTAAVMLVAELLTGEAEYRCTAKARESLRRDIFAKALELDVGNIEKIGPVSAITASVDAVESMQVYYSKYLPGLIYCLIAPFYLYGRISQFSPLTAVILLVVAVVIVPVNNVFRKKIDEKKTEYWKSLENLTGYYLESVQGLTTLKLYGQDDTRTEVLSEKSFDFNKKVMDVMVVNFSSFLLTDGMIYSTVVLAAVIAVSQLAAGRLDFGGALMVLLLSHSFFSSLRALMNATHSALTGVAAADKVEKLLQIDTTRPYNSDIPKEEKPFNGIRIENAVYSYEGRTAALKGVSLDIEKDKVTALVGLSGCGKSTIAGLLMRFFDLKEGRITIEGRDYTSIKPDELRKQIIMVPQAVSLFSGTVAENLRIAAPQATDEELMEALADVRLADWVKAQPDGLNTQVGDAGGKLSGGQRQKIGIARALLCKAEYIIFDESTSSVDMDSEREIWNCINELAQTRTLIIISHRLSTIENADKIYVLSAGEIAESGNHSQLMANNGLYSQLVREQAILEKQGEESVFNG